MHECMNVSVSSHFPENGKSDAIFGSLKNWIESVDGKGTQDGDTHGGIGSS